MQRNTRLSNVILSCHSIREARNFNSVCCNCCYETTGASLTARRAAYTHLCHMRVHSRQKVPRPRESRRAQASTHVIGCNNPRDEVERHKKCNILRYCAAQQQLCETCRCCKRAQISELEHIITVQGPQSQHKSSSADTPLCKDIEHSQCNLSSNCAAPQLLSSVSCVCSSAVVQCENPTCPATTPHRSVPVHTPTCRTKKLASTPPELAGVQRPRQRITPCVPRANCWDTRLVDRCAPGVPISHL